MQVLIYIELTYSGRIEHIIDTMKDNGDNYETGNYERIAGGCL